MLAASQAFGAAINSTGSDHRQVRRHCGCHHTRPPACPRSAKANQHVCSQLQQLLLDAVCGCPHKTALYAHLAGEEEGQQLPHTVGCCSLGQAVHADGAACRCRLQRSLMWLCCAGLLNVDHSDWVGQLVQLVVQQLAGGLAGPAASPAPRLLLRFLACLPAVGVITHASLAQLLQRILEAATAGAHSGEWQQHAQRQELWQQSTPCWQLGHPCLLSRLQPRPGALWMVSGRQAAAPSLHGCTPPAPGDTPVT